MNEIVLTKEERTKKICEFLQDNDKFKKLHDCTERYVYPFIPSNVEAKARENYQIGTNEKVLFIQDFSGDCKSSTVITDEAIRVAYENPMNFVFFTWSKCSRWVYNGETLVHFDYIHKVTTPLHISFIYRSPNAVRHEDMFGENVAEIFNQINQWSPNDTSSTYNAIVRSYIENKRDKDLKNYKSPFKKGLDKAKKGLDEAIEEKHIRIGRVCVSALAVVLAFIFKPEFGWDTWGWALICWIIIIGGGFGLLLNLLSIPSISDNKSKVSKYEKKYNDDMNYRQNETLEQYHARVLAEYKETMEVQVNTFVEENNQSTIDSIGELIEGWNEGVEIVNQVYEGFEAGWNIGSAMLSFLS